MILCRNIFIVLNIMIFLSLEQFKSFKFQLKITVNVTQRHLILIWTNLLDLSVHQIADKDKVYTTKPKRHKRQISVIRFVSLVLLYFSTFKHGNYRKGIGETVKKLILVQRGQIAKPSGSFVSTYPTPVLFDIHVSRRPFMQLNRMFKRLALQSQKCSKTILGEAYHNVHNQPTPESTLLPCGLIFDILLTTCCLIYANLA